MLCPICLKKGEEVKLIVTNSRQWGAFEQVRWYLCKKCGYKDTNIERLQSQFKEERSISAQ